QWSWVLDVNLVTIASLQTSRRQRSLKARSWHPIIQLHMLSCLTASKETFLLLLDGKWSRVLDVKLVTIPYLRRSRRQRSLKAPSWPPINQPAVLSYLTASKKTFRLLLDGKWCRLIDVKLVAIPHLRRTRGQQSPKARSRAPMKQLHALNFLTS